MTVFWVLILVFFPLVLQLQNQSELRAPTPEKAAWFLDAAIAARHSSQRPNTTEEEHRNSHMLFTLHLYQYRMEKTGKGGSKYCLDTVITTDMFTGYYQQWEIRTKTKYYSVDTAHYKNFYLGNNFVDLIITAEWSQMQLWCCIAFTWSEYFLNPSKSTDDPIRIYTDYLKPN